MSENAFRAAGYSWRLYCGRQVIEQEPARRPSIGPARSAPSSSAPVPSTGAPTPSGASPRRSATVTPASSTASRRTRPTSRCAPPRDGRQPTPGADLLIAVGGGSVIVATRAVAIFMAEPGDPFRIMTQYPEGKPAYSPRLLGAEAADHQHSDHAEQRDEPRRHRPEEPGPRPPHGVFRSQDAPAFDLPR